MVEWLSQLPAGQVIALLAVSGGVLIAVVSVAAGAWVRVRRADLQAHLADVDAALKQQMIERGMSVDEIERVLAAGRGRYESRSLANEREG